MIISKKQFGIMAFIAMITFKISLLPSLLYQAVGTSTWLLITLYMLIECLSFLIVYRIVDKGYTEDYERITSSFMLKVLMIIIYAFLIMKAMVYIGELIAFVKYYFFENLDGILAIMLLGLPIIYLGIKGNNTIGRLSELSFMVILICYFFNLIFFKTNVYVESNMPLFDCGVNNFFSKGFKYFIYFGDATPFLFMTMAERKEKNYVPLYAVFASIIVVVLSFLAVSIYGGALVGVKSFIVRLGSFNDFSQELGRFDWTGILGWFYSALIEISIIFSALIKAGTKILNKPKLLGIISYSIILIIMTFGIRNEEQMLFYAEEYFNYIAIIVGLGLPLLVLYKVKMKRKYEVLQK